MRTANGTDDARVMHCEDISALKKGALNKAKLKHLTLSPLSAPAVALFIRNKEKNAASHDFVFLIFSFLFLSLLNFPPISCPCLKACD